MKTNFFTMMAATALCVVLSACGGEQKVINPLGVQAPEWQQFAHPKGEGATIYKLAKADAPVLQIASEPVEGDYGESEILWSDQKPPRGWYVNNYDISSSDALPIIGEEGNFYKVYVSNQWLGGEEGYIKKSDCDIVKAAALTPEVVDSIGKTEFRSDNIIKEGDLQSLCFSSFLGDYDEMSFKMGQLCDLCIVYPDTKPVTLNVTMGNAPITFAKAEEEENYLLSAGEDQLYQPGPESPSVFDTKKLSGEQINQLYSDLKLDGAELKEVVYYIPEVSKERFIHIYIFPTGTKLYAAQLNALDGFSNPQAVTAVPGCPFAEQNALGYWTSKSGNPAMLFIIYQKGSHYYDVEFDAYKQRFREPHDLNKGTTHGMEVFRCVEEREYYQIDSENGGLVIRDMGDPGFVIDKKSPMEWKQ